MKVLLEIKGEQQQVVVGKLKVLQFTSTLKKIKEILKIMKDNDKLKELLEFLMGDGSKAMGEDGQIDKEQVEDMLDDKFMGLVIESLEVLLEEVPDKAIELIAILSGIDIDILNEQDFETLFDVVDAIASENDLRKLVDRAKKSLGGLKDKFGK